MARLKGGDSFVFGRGGEELLALKEAGIPFEVVPGITSAIAAPAYVGIPVTHRGVSAALHILTWHSANGLPPEPMKLQGLAAAGGTLVILMGAGKTGEIGTSLIAAGFAPEKPVAIIREGATARQQRIDATLGSLAADASLQKIIPPALIVVGEVCSLGTELSWAECRPLHGVRVAVTRPEPKNTSLCDKIRSLGGEAISIPCIGTSPLTVERNSLEDAVRPGWLVFTSAAGVNAFFGSYMDAGMDLRRLHSSRFAVIGPSTSQALRIYGIHHDYMPDVYDASHLGQGLAAFIGPTESILLIRAAIGSSDLNLALEEAGITYAELPVYQTRNVQGNEVGRRTIEQKEFDYITFASASAVRSFAQSFSQLNLIGLHALCIGEPTARVAAGLGMTATVADYATEEGICNSIVRLWQKERRV